MSVEEKRDARSNTAHQRRIQALRELRERELRKASRGRRVLRGLGRAARYGWPYALALALLAAGAGVRLEAPGSASAGPVPNRALLDKAATARVLSELSAGTVAVFSYSYADLPATESAADRVLTGRASEQYQQLFGTVLQNAPAQKLALTTKVVKAGVVRLTTAGDATAVLFLEQVATRAGKPYGGTIAAQLTVTAHKDARGGGWRITDMQAV